MEVEQLSRSQRGLGRNGEITRGIGLGRRPPSDDVVLARAAVLTETGDCSGSARSARPKGWPATRSGRRAMVY